MNRSEKGLFTFYWEQYQTCNSSAPLSFRKSTKLLQEDDDIAENNSPKIEEKKNTNKYLSKPKSKQKTEKMQHIQDHSVVHKENKVARSILKIDLSSFLKKEIEERAFRMITNRQVKESKEQVTVHTHKSSTCELPSLGKQDTSRSKKHCHSPRGDNIFDKLIQGEQSLEPIKLDIKISDDFTLKKEEKVRTNRIKKTKKNDNNFKNSHRNNKLECNCLNLPKETPTYRFPMLNSLPKKMKNSKESYMIERIVLDRQQINRSNSSVVLLGIDQGDEHKVRWQRRKQQFLGMLSRNNSCNASQ